MKEDSRNRASPSKGTWKEGSFTGDPKRYVRALERVSVSPGAPLLGNIKTLFS